MKHRVSTLPTYLSYDMAINLSHDIATLLSHPYSN